MTTNSPAATAAKRLIQRALVWVLCAAGGGLLAFWRPSAFVPVLVVAASGWVLFAGFVLYFFRDPTPVVPQAREAIVSPAHGLVDLVRSSAARPWWQNGQHNEP
jgi:hypothetical protein